MDPFNVEDFYKEDNLYLVPSYIDSTTRAKIINIWSKQNLKEHVFLLSSGTSSRDLIKTYAISKKSIIENAKAVNKFLNLRPSDKWLASLPHFHIGGLSIFVRAFECGCENHIFKSKWNPILFIDTIEKEKINYTSIVPTQLFDLIKTKKNCPKSLKGIFVGGDFLASELKERALALNWPLIQTYGMTEASSQIASSFCNKMVDGFMEVLNIHKLISKENSCFLESNTLFTCEILIKPNEVRVTKQKTSEYKINDNLDILNKEGIQYLKPLGRMDDEIKIKGRLYDFLKLKDIAETVFLELDVYTQVELVLQDDDRDGKILGLYYSVDVKDIIFEVKVKLDLILPKTLQIRFSHEFEKLDRTSLGKLRRN